MIAVVIVVLMIAFGLMHAVPGGPLIREKALMPGEASCTKKNPLILPCAVFLVLPNLAIDMSSAYLDPRICHD